MHQLSPFPLFLVHIAFKNFSPLSSPWPRRPSRPITTLQGRDVIWTIPMHHSHNFCSPILRADTLLFRDLNKKKMGKRSLNESKLSLGQNQQDSKEPTHTAPNALRKRNEEDLYLTKAQHHFTCTTNTKAAHLFGKAIFTMQVSSNSPWRSVQEAKSQRWSWDKQ